MQQAFLRDDVLSSGSTLTRRQPECGDRPNATDFAAAIKPDHCESAERLAGQLMLVDFHCSSIARLR